MIQNGRYLYFLYARNCPNEHLGFSSAAKVQLFFEIAKSFSANMRKIAKCLMYLAPTPVVYLAPARYAHEKIVRAY